MIKVPTGWQGDPKSIKKVFTFKSFEAAMHFMDEVALYCARVDHHPEWKNIYNKVWVKLTTHDSGCVTKKDTALATHMDEVAATILVTTGQK